MKNTADSVIYIGQHLLEVKDKLQHGQFGDWLKAEFDWTPRTTQNFINVAVRFGDQQKRNIFAFAPSALYLLSSPSLPEEAVQEATARAKQGEQITHKTAKGIVEKHTLLSVLFS